MELFPAVMDGSDYVYTHRDGVTQSHVTVDSNSFPLVDSKDIERRIAVSRRTTAARSPSRRTRCPMLCDFDWNRARTTGSSSGRTADTLITGREKSRHRILPPLELDGESFAGDGASPRECGERSASLAAGD